jgi:hypothetical protein
VAGDELRVERTSGASDATVGWTATGPGAVRIEAHCPGDPPVRRESARHGAPRCRDADVSVDTGEVWSSAIADLTVEVDEGIVDIGGRRARRCSVGRGGSVPPSWTVADAKLVVASGDVDVTLDGGAWDVGVVAREQDVAEIPSGGAGRLDVWAAADARPWSRSTPGT